MAKQWQCKALPDHDVLELIASAGGSPLEALVARYPGCPRKLILRKLARLAERGMLTGSTTYRLTEAGECYIAAPF